MASPGIVLPLVVLGAAVLFLGGGAEAAPEEGPVRRRPAPVPSTPSQSVQFQMLMGDADRSYHLPVRITPDQVVVLFSEFEEDCPEGTRTQLCHVSQDVTRNECIWLAEPPEAILEALGAPQGQFVKVHQPLGRTDPRPDWDEDTTELVPMWINRDHIQMIGPSPIMNIKRRRLGKIYTHNGLDFELYESLEQLREIMGSSVLEISEKFRPRELR